MFMVDHRGRIAVRAALCVVVSLAASAEPKRATSGQITEIRFWSLADATRVAIEIDSEFTFRSDKIDNPTRLFFDLPGIRPQSSKKGTVAIPVGDSILKQIRTAETKPGTTRIVLDIVGDAEYTTTELSNPQRLVIELRRPGGAKPDKKFTPPDTASATIGPVEVKAAPAELKATTPAAALKTAPAGEIRTPQPNAELKTAPPPKIQVMSTLTGPPAMTSSTSPAEPMPKSTMAAATPLPAKRVGSGDRSMTRVLGLKLGRVVLDPGHGGHDEGTRGPSGLLEKDLVLDVSQRLAAIIEERLGSEVVFTRADDTFIPLERRTKIANEHKADLFLSIHANSSPVRTASGVETYYLNFTTNKAALDVAARENAGASRSIYDLKELVEKIALKDKLEESKEFALRVQTSLSALSARTGTTRDRGVRRAPFIVLIGASMPSILAEIGFVSNSRDEQLLKRPEYRQKLAEALYKGVASYANTLSRSQVAQRKSSE